MDYAEATHFDGYHFKHIAAWKEHQRLKRCLTLPRWLRR